MISMYFVVIGLLYLSIGAGFSMATYPAWRERL